ncbi:MAG: hypothetical protein KGL39_53375 [Patescibacteria group bacterium]|nr:hypothetical protein [Patescibacteria group bacterium]
MKYSDGTICNAADLADALAAVRLNYPDAVAYQGGSRVDETDDVRYGGRILIWADEASSVNDDGAKAVAVIEDV